MKAKALALKSRLFGGGGTTSGVLGGIGITTQILPLMFLQTYQFYFWIAALIFTVASLYFFLKQKHFVTKDRNLLLINGGLLLFGMPFTQVTDYMDFFRFSGGGLAMVGVLLLIFGKKFQPVYRHEIATSVASLPPRNDIVLPKLSIQSLLFVIVIGGFLVNQYLMYRIASKGQDTKGVSNALTFSVKPVSRMKLTSFDVALAKERMDKNNDGICDVCGMPMQQCIDSGQLDCNMGGNTDAIGILGSQHIHADLKVYVNGQALDFAKPEYFMKSAFLHVDSSQNIQDASSVLHMHAKKVPLWLFFRSLGMKLEKDSFTTVDGQIHKNESGNSLKFYLNGHKVDELGDYVFQPLDKFLINYGPDNDPDIQKQINSVTNFAKDHQK